MDIHTRIIGGHDDQKVICFVDEGGWLMWRKAKQGNILNTGIYDEGDEDSNPSVLKRLAKVTGGEAYFPESSKDIVSICEKIARNIRNQYTLAYVPNVTATDGNYRNVVVKASAPGHGRLTVRTRPGYFMSSAAPKPGGR